MLILTRKIGDSVIIDQNIKVKVLGVEGDQVRLGFEAPASISIFREELLQDIKEQNVDAAQSVGSYNKGLAEQFYKIFRKKDAKEGL